MILNNGTTPAYRVRSSATAKIIPDSLVAHFQFQIPDAAAVSQASIGPRENRIMSAIVPDYVDDADVEGIKKGDGKALWVWGIVHYDDVFGHARFTEFCQRLLWLPDGQIMGMYDSRLGRST